MSQDPIFRAVISDLRATCVEELEPSGGAIQLVAKKLFDKDELAGEEVNGLLKVPRLE